MTDIDRYKGNEPQLYSPQELTGSFVSAYRPIQHIVNQYRSKEFINKDLSSLEVLDYGAGMGRLINLIKTTGVSSPVGVDISPSMLESAKLENPWMSLAQMGEALPFSSEQFDLVFSTIVLVDIPTLDQMQDYFEESRRVLKPDGAMIVITATPESYKIDTPSFKCKFPENRHLGSGDQAKVIIGSQDEPQYDFVWTDDDHQGVISKAGLKILETRQIYERQTPIWGVYVVGRKELNWRSERHALYESARAFSK